MLQIKLPKSKTAKACERLATILEQKYEVDVAQYEAEVERWREIRASMCKSSRWMTLTMMPHYTGISFNAAKKFRDRATACMASAGDVYISVELWNEIKEHYYA